MVIFHLLHQVTGNNNGE